MFGLIFGEEWREAGDYTRHLIPWLSLVYLNTPMTVLVNIIGEQDKYLYYEIALLVARVIAISAGKLVFDDALVTICLFAYVSFIFNIYLSYYLFYQSREKYVFNR